ncbi:MAG: hypothetical protein M1576_03775 [Deltaproteobacteria bacterium]|nr:hypothetical protein [Deltaproteobacteria bacterium]
MIDIELFRKNPEIFEAEIKKRNMKIDVLADINLDKRRRKLISAVDGLRAKKNENTKLSANSLRIFQNFPVKKKIKQ